MLLFFVCLVDWLFGWLAFVGDGGGFILFCYLTESHLLAKVELRLRGTIPRISRNTQEDQHPQRPREDTKVERAEQSLNKQKVVN